MSSSPTASNPPADLDLPHSPNRLNRRRFLALTGRGAAGALALSWLGENAAEAELTGSPVFLHGVASGDPLANAVVLWTRITPVPEATPGSLLGAPTMVVWQVATDVDFTQIVANGSQTSNPARDHTINVDVQGLQALTVYYYRFSALGVTSRVGRTKTTAAAAFNLASLRFGLVSCSNYEGGYFGAYRFLALRDDLDFVLHVGDYYYEYASGEFGPGPRIGRVNVPLNETISLKDYRQRQGNQKTDLDLQAVHAAHPFICTIDDHETANDAWKNGAENHDANEGSYQARKIAAFTAYREWMPVRFPSQQGRIYRQFNFGNLVELLALDLRQYRDKQPTSGTDPVINDENRTITGDPQMAWIKSRLVSTPAQWKLIGNPDLFAPVIQPPIDIGLRSPSSLSSAIRGIDHAKHAGTDATPELTLTVPFDTDAWNGYKADQRELVQHIGQNKIDDVVFLTGDIHSSWACDVPSNTDLYLLNRNSVAVEFVGPSVTSDNLNDFLLLPEGNPLSTSVEVALKTLNPFVKYLNLDAHGYTVIDVTPERVHADWFFVNNRTDPTTDQRFAIAFEAEAGNPHIRSASGPVS